MNIELKVLEALKENNHNETGRKKLVISRGAYSKAMLYAKLVSRIAGTGMECYSYMLKKQDAFDDTISEIYFADDQSEQSAFVRVTPEGVKRAGDTVRNRGYEIVGWTHSHGDMQPFHSSWDKENFLTILHEISPQTMYRNEVATHMVKDEIVYVDNYKIEGVKPNGKVRVTKKVERVPFAFSMVVNNRGEYYLECQTKKYNPVTNQFVVKEPYHPELEIVDVPDDLKLDVPEMEWEIYEKVRMSRGIEEELDDSGHESDYEHICGIFKAEAQKYISMHGKHSATIKAILSEKDAYSVLRELSSASNGKLVTNTLEQRLAKSSIQRYLNRHDKLKKHELENLLLLQMMTVFSKKFLYTSEDQLVKEQDALIEEYHRKANSLHECAELAENATKSLTRYAMETATDYKHEQNHHYRKFMSSILANMSGNEKCSFKESVRKATNKKYTATELMLLKERVNVFSQLVADLYEAHEAGKSCYLRDFVKEFSDAYLHRPNDVDHAIEKYLLESRMKQTEYHTVADTSLVVRPERGIKHVFKKIWRYLPQFGGNYDA